VGDILTVIIEIDDEASLSNQTRRNRAGSDEASVTAMFGINKLIEDLLPKDATLDPAIGLSSTTNSSGAGSVQRTEEITLKLAATVTDMLPNGHLVIFGSQELRVNYELRDLQIAGIIRPEDISRRNEITYDKIADARVVYGGRGQITDMQQPRLGQQVIDIVSPF
jgi:flagellar L-ring protein precursor FlgH